MNMHLKKLDDQQRLDDSSSSIGLTSNTISRVSTSLKREKQNLGCPPDMPITFEKERSLKNWYVLRAAYSSEKLAYDYILQNSKPNEIEVFWPKCIADCKRHGKIVEKEVSLIPNILFACASREDLDRFVYDNVHLPNLRYYYHQYHKNELLVREPLMIPDRQMKSFIQIYTSPKEDTYISRGVIQKFAKGQLVRVIDGPFKGVVGRVARFKGQQRVGVITGGVMTAVTTWIKNRYLEVINED